MLGDGADEFAGSDGDIFPAAIQLEKLPYELARWVEGEGLDARAVDRDSSTAWCEDRDGKPVVLFFGSCT